MDKLNEMNNKEEKNEIIIKYKIDKIKKEINIFGEKFVNNNKNNYILIYDGNEYELSVKLNIKNVGNKTIEVKLKEIKNVTNMESMFFGCSSLLSLTDISKWNNIMLLIWKVCLRIVHHYHLYLIYQNGIHLMLLI